MVQWDTVTLGEGRGIKGTSAKGSSGVLFSIANDFNLFYANIVLIIYP